MDWIGHRRDVSPAKTDYASASPEESEASLLRLGDFVSLPHCGPHASLPAGDGAVKRE